MDRLQDLLDQVGRASRPDAGVLRAAREAGSLASVQKAASDLLKSPYSEILTSLQARDATPSSAYRAAVEATGRLPAAYRDVALGGRVGDIVALASSAVAAQHKALLDDFAGGGLARTALERSALGLPGIVRDAVGALGMRDGLLSGSLAEMVRRELKVGSVLAADGWASGGFAGGGRLKEAVSSLLPGYRVTAELALGRVVAAGAGSDLLRHYADVGAGAPMFDAVRSAVTALDMFEGDEDALVAAFERVWSLLVDALGGAGRLAMSPKTLAMVTWLALLLSVIGTAPVVLPHPDPMPALSARLDEANRELGGIRERLDRSHAAARHVRYVHAPVTGWIARRNLRQVPLTD